MNELLAGAKIALPTQVLTILTLLKTGQQTIFGFFVTGLVLNFIMAPLSLMALRSWTWSVPLVFFSFLTGLLINAATIVATIFSVAAKYAITLQSELNIRVHVSGVMLAAMWVAALLSSAAFFLHCAVGCCCHRHRKRHLTEREAMKTVEKEKAEAEEVKKKWIGVPGFMRKRKPGTVGGDALTPGAMIA
jgi:hypothetical protein